MSTSGDIIAAIDRAGFRLTEARRRVAELVADRDGHFSAADLLEAARRRRLDIGRATVFRTLDVLVALGMVERIDLPNGEHAYVTCAPLHHHHVVCSTCGDATEVTHLGMDTIMREAARRTGYRVDAHRVELFGLCPACQETTPTA